MRRITSEKRMQLLARAACAASALVLGGVSTTYAASIGVNAAWAPSADSYSVITPTPAGNPQPLMGEDAGVVDQYYWNNTAFAAASNNGSLSSLLDSTGATTTMSISWITNEDNLAANSVVTGTSTTGDQELYEGLWRTTLTNAMISVTSVPYSQYSLYIYYGLQTAPRTNTIQLAGTNLGTQTVVVADSIAENYNPTTGFVNGNAGSVVDGNYLLFTGITTNSFNIFSLGQAGVTGIQVVDTSAPVPEPASLGLLAISGLGLLSRRRKTQT